MRVRKLAGAKKGVRWPLVARGRRTKISKALIEGRVRRLLSLMGGRGPRLVRLGSQGGHWGNE